MLSFGEEANNERGFSYRYTKLGDQCASSLACELLDFFPTALQTLVMSDDLPSRSWAGKMGFSHLSRILRSDGVEIYEIV